MLLKVLNFVCKTSHEFNLLKYSYALKIFTQIYKAGFIYLPKYCV